MTFLLDTNHVIAHLNGDPRMANHVVLHRATGDVFAINTTVLGELYFGAYASRRPTENLGGVNSFLDEVDLFEFDRAAAEEFGRIKAEQRAKGRPIPTADAQIAAVARLRGLTVLTNDAHFQSVHALKTDNWLA
ncbi:MAG: type II toxin-antitoxin system VapC family toxin [Planctomycetales bacterium]